MRGVVHAGSTLAVIALLVVSGCGDDDEETTTTEAADTSELVGTYAREVTESDLDRTESLRREGAGQTRPPAGSYELTFTEDDLTVSDPNGVSIAELYKAEAEGTLETAEYLENSFCGPDVPLSASYTWEVSGETLELRAEQDPCADRDSILTGSWTRK